MNYAQAGRRSGSAFAWQRPGRRALRLPHVSQWLGSQTITGVLEVTSGVSDRDGVKSRTHRLHQSLAAPGPALPEQPLELGKRLLYGVEVR
jgi:hypothetical protein